VAKLDGIERNPGQERLRLVEIAARRTHLAEEGGSVREWRRERVERHNLKTAEIFLGGEEVALLYSQDAAPQLIDRAGETLPGTTSVLNPRV
jgi:hypothetical protein